MARGEGGKLTLVDNQAINELSEKSMCGTWEWEGWGSEFCTLVQLLYLCTLGDCPFHSTLVTAVLYFMVSQNFSHWLGVRRSFAGSKFAKEAFSKLRSALCLLIYFKAKYHQRYLYLPFMLPSKDTLNWDVSQTE